MNILIKNMHIYIDINNNIVDAYTEKNILLYQQSHLLK